MPPSALPAAHCTLTSGRCVGNEPRGLRSPSHAPCPGGEMPGCEAVRLRLRPRRVVRDISMRLLRWVLRGSPLGAEGRMGGLSLLRPHGPPRSPQATPSRRPRSTALHGARAPLPGAGARSPRGLASADGGLGPGPLAAQPGEQPSQPGGVRRRMTWHGLRGAARCSGGPCSSDSRARPFGVRPCGWAWRLRAHRPVSRPVPGANAPAGGDTLASGGGGELPHHSAPPGAPQPGRTLPRPHPSPQRGPTL